MATIELVDDGQDRWRIPRREGMLVDGVVFASKRLLVKAREDKALEQVCNVAHLSGIVGASFAMPDIHWGYGFPIGGVAATDVDAGRGRLAGRGRVRHRVRGPAAALPPYV